MILTWYHYITWWQYLYFFATKAYPLFSPHPLCSAPRRSTSRRCRCVFYNSKWTAAKILKKIPMDISCYFPDAGGLNFASLAELYSQQFFSFEYMKSEIEPLLTHEDVSSVESLNMFCLSLEASGLCGSMSCISC